VPDGRVHFVKTASAACRLLAQSEDWFLAVINCGIGELTRTDLRAWLGIRRIRVIVMHAPLHQAGMEHWVFVSPGCTPLILAQALRERSISPAPRHSLPLTPF
jgi:hypothetical protein